MGIRPLHSGVVLWQKRDSVAGAMPAIAAMVSAGYPKRLIEVDLPIKRISKQKLEETKLALRELGLDDSVATQD